MKNKENFLKIVSETDTRTIAESNQRIKRRAMLRESQQIAMKVLIKLDELGWAQRDLAKAMDVSPQQISKIVSGKENLTIDTQIKLQNILNIPVLASYYENSIPKIDEWILTIEKRGEMIPAKFLQISNTYQDTITMRLDCMTYPQEINQLRAIK